MLFSLIKSLTKSEKRNFKLFCAPSESLKYLQLYEVIDKMERYDEAAILKACPDISKTQLYNLKSQLYHHILRSLEQLFIKHNKVAQIRQGIDFAAILIDKGDVNSAIKILNRVKAEALQFQFYTLALEVIEQIKTVELMHVGRVDLKSIEVLRSEATAVSNKISKINDLSNLSIQLSSLNLKLGYARSEKDKTLIINYFYRKLSVFDDSKMEFHEKLYYYQCKTWYYMIQYDFVQFFKWASRWKGLFDGKDFFKIIYFDHYIRANSRMLDVLFMTRRLSSIKQVISNLEVEREAFLPSNQRTYQTIELTLLFGKINAHFLEGSFKEGIKLVDRAEMFIKTCGDMLPQHYRMMLNYKVACLYFGCAEYKSCIKYLQRIIQVKDPKFRRDLQVFSRILNLIASYEIGDDETLERQIKSVYSFVIKTNDMQAVQNAIIHFLRRVPYAYAGDFKNELKILYNELKQFESDPYQRRPFFYLDIISWLESKIYNESIAEIRRKKITLK